MKPNSLLLRLPLALAAALACNAASAGAFLYSTGILFENFPSLRQPANPNNVTHPVGYNVATGSPAQFNVNVCVVPGSVQASDVDIAAANAVDLYNALVPVTRNMRNDDSFDDTFPLDFESVLIHEVGHCIGLAHPNAASEAMFPSNEREKADSTKAGEGGNGVLDVDFGADNLYGSADDLRGDDVNVHYFEPGVNDPFRIYRSTDAANYTRNVAQLPPGDSFATNADRAVGDLPRYDPDGERDPCRDLAGTNFFQAGDVCQEAVMQQGTGSLETQRALAPDDVAMLQYARSGLDRQAGTSDDYQPTLVYRGISNQNCDISLSFNNAETSFAVCRAGFNSGGASFDPVNGHIGLTSAEAFFNTGRNWRFSTVRVPLAVADSAVVAPGDTTNITTSVLANDSNQHGSGTLAASPEIFGGGDAGTVVMNSNGTFSYANTNPGATEDFFIYEVCVSGATNPGGIPACAWQFVELTIDALANDLVFENGFEGDDF